MPRKKRAIVDTTATTPAATEPSPEATTALAVAQPEREVTEAPATEPAPQDRPDSDIRGPNNPDAKNWGDPYKAVFTSTAMGFEMGENRRYRQRVFMFKDKPADQIRAALHDNGFTYRANEKAWTITANAETRVLSDRLAKEFAGQAQSAER